MRTFLLFILLIALSACYSVKQHVEAGKPFIQKIEWPKPYLPDQSKFFVHNAIHIDADSQSIWNVLIAAKTWQSYYSGARVDSILQADTAGNLGPSSILKWKTMGLQFTSSIREFTPGRSLAWESIRGNIQGYHAWLILPDATGCMLITEEAQKGWLTFFEKTFQANKLERLHQEWLEGIKHIVESKNHE
ncbi:MAG: SRPBCC domain-containing protein [Bacteroidetes bacterium]|nr:SRPBCC domain-containing protein [Bacteroidota bacterium]